MLFGRVKRHLLMYNYLMTTSLETQEIMIAFEVGNKDNLDSWGKYVLEELKDAYADMPEDDRASTTGQRIKDRIEELEKEEAKNDRLEEKAEQRSHNSKQSVLGYFIAFVLALIAMWSGNLWFSN